MGLYERFADDLRSVREEQRALYERQGYARWQRHLPYRVVRTLARRAGFDPERKRYMNPMLDDIEAEITYLRLRERRPQTVVEISPFRGWSTTWILRALRDNGGGKLTSFDLVEDASRFVPAELTEGWQLVKGDVREQLSRLDERIDYLFIDADHGRGFAEWYLEQVVPRAVPGGAVSVHDIFHGRAKGRQSGEARVVLDWLGESGIDWFTASRFGPGRIHDQLQAERLRLGLTPAIHTGDHDSMIFFEL